MKKKSARLVSVIDIGSNEIRLKIGQNGGDSLEPKIIESLIYPLSLGRDTFNTGKISFEKADKVCEIISNFIKLSNEYGVEKIKTVATSAVRESYNRDYILDQIRIKTGIPVEVIDNLEEKYYIYKLMTNVLPKEIKQSAIMVYIGSGNVGISLVEDEKIPFVQNIKVGSLRISELFGDIHDYSRDFSLVVEEYLETFTDMLETILPIRPKHFIASGSEISLIAHLCKAEFVDNFFYIHKSKFDNLYNDIKSKTVNAIMDDYGISFDKAELLLPAICIFDNILQFAEADTIIAPTLQLTDSLIFEMLYPDEYSTLKKQFYKNTVLSSRVFADRFHASRNHYSIVEKFCIKIFDKLKKIHGLSGKERILLQAAAIMHDIGKIINIRTHYRHSYNIIKGFDIVGLNIRDIEIVACVCLYHSRIIPTLYDSVYMGLSENDRVIVSKLTSILRLADALDRSHEQKFQDINVRLEENVLTIYVTTDKNIELEEWSFKDKGLFFEEVFGIKTVLRKKKVS